MVDPTCILGVWAPLVHSHPSGFCHLIFIISFLVKVKLMAIFREMSISCFVIFNTIGTPKKYLCKKRIMDYYFLPIYGFQQIFFSFPFFFFLFFFVLSLFFSLQDSQNLTPTFSTFKTLTLFKYNSFLMVEKHFYTLKSLIKYLSYYNFNYVVSVKTLMQTTLYQEYKNKTSIPNVYI